MGKRGWNLKRSQPDGDRGRSAGGRLHALRNREPLGDDSHRTMAEYWGYLAWAKLQEAEGKEGAHQIQSERGVASFAKEMAEMDEYLAEMREAANESQSAG